jgi:hypothetical protein
MAYSCLAAQEFAIYGTRKFNQDWVKNPPFGFTQSPSKAYYFIAPWFKATQATFVFTQKYINYKITHKFNLCP